MTEGLSGDLLALLGDRAFVSLAQAFGGTRLYVPHEIPTDHEITRAIGAEPARRLSHRIAPAVIRVPLARDFRARHYRAGGLSNAQIARKLGITETGVDKLFRRMENAPGKGTAQLSFFSDNN